MNFFLFMGAYNLQSHKQYNINYITINKIDIGLPMYN